MQKISFFTLSPEHGVADRAQLTNTKTVADSVWSFLSAGLLLCECALVWMQSSALLLCQPRTSTQKRCGGGGWEGGGGWYLRWSVSVSISPGLKGRKERRQIALCGGGSVCRFLVAGNRRGVCYCTRGSILIISPMQRTHGHISLLSARTYRRTRPLMSHNKQPSI